MDVERYRSPFDLEDYVLVKIAQSQLDQPWFDLSIARAQCAVMPSVEWLLAETDV